MSRTDIPSDPRLSKRLGTRRSQRGFIGVFGALTLLAMMLFAGLVIDVGYLQWQKRQAQAAADAAAVGAVQELRAGGGSVVTAARADAALNGFTDSTNNTTVTVNRPPQYGSYAGNNGAVEAIVTRTVPTFFMMLAGRNTATVSARAVATSYSAGGSASGCVVALDKTMSRAISLAGSNSTYSACSWVTESTSGSAFYMEGSGTLYMQNGASVGIMNGAGYQLTGQTKIWDVAANRSVTPVKVADPGDPLADVPAPTTGTMRKNNGQAYYDMNSRPPNNTIEPGIYCGGLKFGSTGGATFTMNPGTYIMAGGGFQTGSQARISAQGVTIYNTSSNGWGCSGSYPWSIILVDGQGTMTLSAPTSGPLKGVLMFDDRSMGANQQHRVVGGSGGTIDGALYFRNASLLFSGTSSVTGYMFLIADSIQINGNSTIGANYSSLGGSNPFLPPTSGGLAE